MVFMPVGDFFPGGDGIPRLIELNAPVANGAQISAQLFCFCRMKAASR